MNHKYIDTKTFDIVNNVFEVDEKIAESISLLNKKGYYTRYSCSGHVKDPRMYEMYRVKKSEKFDDKDLGYVVKDNEDDYEILMPNRYTSIYVMFDKKYEFDNLPIGFYTLDDEVTTIYKDIMYYENKIKKKSNDIESEIKKFNIKLLEWVKSLPIIK